MVSATGESLSTAGQPDLPHPRARSFLTVMSIPAGPFLREEEEVVSFDPTNCVFLRPWPMWLCVWLVSANKDVPRCSNSAV
jgi:hypothetical protein